MPESIDSLFENAAQTPENTHVDISRADALEQAGLAPDPRTPTPTEQAIPLEAAPAPQQADPSGAIAGQGGTVRGGQEAPGAPLEGLAKAFEENVGIPVVDFFDNLTGDNRTPDEIAQDRQATRTDSDQTVEDFRQNQPEAARVVSGGIRGAGESLLNTGEIIGDTVKTFAGVAQESDQVFGSKYDWAKWDLGKDRYGAKTGVGKVAQGFAEFGVLMATTGGFGGAGAGAGLAKTALTGGLKGVAADMISAAKGEGNMSNLIKENAPEWYPSWLTALAVDEDDNPWEAMFKTGAEGFGMGVLADGAIGGFMKGTQAVKKLLKKNPAATIAEQSEVAIKAASEQVNKPTAPSTRLSSIEGAAKTATPERFERVAPLLDQATKGIPVHYDDVANAFPEYFTIPGAGRANIQELDIGEFGVSTPLGSAGGRDFQMNFGADMNTDGATAVHSVDFSAGNDYDFRFDDPKEAVKLLNSFRDTTLQQIPAGTVLTNQPVREELASVYARLGFDKFEGLGTWQSAVVAVDPATGKKILKPANAGGNLDMAKFDEASAGVRASTVKPMAGREVPDEFNPAVYEALGTDFSMNPFTGEVPTSGTMVAIDGEVLADVTEESVANFIAKNRDILSRDDVFIGSWVSKETGKPVVELSRLVGDVEEAKTLGRIFDQEGVFDIDLARSTNFEKGYLPTDGTDTLRNTKGGHIGQANELPSDITPASATQVTAQQMQMRATKDFSARADSGRTVTDAQLHKIAKEGGASAGAVLRKVVDENPVDVAHISKISRTTPDEIVAEAGKAIQDSLNTAGDVDFNKLLKQQVGEDNLLTQAGIVQVRGLMQEMSSRIANEALDIKKLGSNGEEIFTHFDRMVDQLKNLTYIHKESANSYSRLLGTYKVKVPVLGKEIELPSNFKAKDPAEQAAELADQMKALDELKAQVRSGDPKAKSQAVRIAAAMDLADGDVTKMLSFAAQTRKLAGEDFLSVMYNSMLSGPATHIVNTASAAFQVVYRPLAAMQGGDANVKKQAIASFYGFWNNLGESAQIAHKAFKENGANVQGDKGFVQSGEVRQAMKQLQLAAEATQDLGEKAGLGWADTLHTMAEFPLFNWPTKLMTTTDEFFKAMVSRMEYQAQTMGKAIDAAEGSEDGIEAAYKALIEKTYDQNFTKSGELLNEDLLKVAKEATFQTELDGWAKSFAQFVNNVPVMRPFFPFIKTGHNVMVYTGTHVPILNRYMKEYKAVMDGTDEYTKAVFKGREAFGRQLVVLGATAAYTGAITGNGPPDPAERKIWLQTNQPNSFKIGDKFISYSRIDGLGQILSGIADLADMSKYMVKHGVGTDQIEYLSGYLTYAIAQNFTNKSYMQGVVPLGKLLTPGNQSVNAIGTIGLEQINSFIPLAGARRAFANAMTPNMREYNNEYQRILASMGAGRLLGAPAHDWLDASELESASGASNSLNPLKTVTRKQSPVRDMLEDVGFDSSVISKTYRGVKLTDVQRSEVSKLMGGSGLEKRLKKIMDKPAFKKSRDKYFDDVRGNRAVDKRATWHYRQLQKEVIKTRDWALKQMRKNHPDIHASLADEARSKREARQGSFETIQEFYQQ